MNLDASVGTLEDFWLDMSNVTVAMTKTFVWHLTGRFIRSHDIRPSRVEFWVCLSRLTSSLLFMRRALEAHGLSVLRALAELVEASMDMTGAYQNDDGVPNFGACNPHIGDAASVFFWTFHASNVQFRGTSQGACLSFSWATQQRTKSSGSGRIWSTTAGTIAIF